MLALAPGTMRDVLDRVERAVGPLETPAVAITTSGCRYFLRQAVEASMPNLFFLSHNEVPAGVRVVSLGVIQ
jgi:flagellar biosynthesis component FlhA